jgi:phenylalanyl-tRNA synthetase beta chain
VRSERIHQLLGMTIPVSQTVDILHRLGFKYEDHTVTVPTFRPDIAQEADIIEEIARIINYDTLPVASTSIIHMEKEANTEELFHERVKTACCELGLMEIITNSMVSRKDIEAVGDSVNVTILNPISDDMNAMRPSLLIGMLKVVAYNINRQLPDLRFFELGRIFKKNAAVNPDDQPYALAMVVHGLRHKKGWEGAVSSVDFFDIKGLVEAFCLKIFLDNLDFILYDRNGYFRPGQALSIMKEGERIGDFGRIKAEITSVFGIESDVYACELLTDKIGRDSRSRLRYHPYSRFPAIEKDLALVVDSSVSAEELRQFIHKAGKPLAQDVTIFDLYRGKHLESERKSLALRIRFQSIERTLTDKEVNEIFETIIKEVEKKFNAKLRI